MAGFEADLKKIDELKKHKETMLRGSREKSIFLKLSDKEE